MSDIVELKILNNGEGISHAIDRKLDTDFGKDIKLNLEQWNTIFNFVKVDNATSSKQYRGEDSDISNGAHYQVSKGSYYLTQTTWTKITNFVTGIVNSKKSVETKAENQAKNNTQTDVKTTVKSILGEKGCTNYTEQTLEKAIERYNQIKREEPELDEAIVKQRISNFVNAIAFLEIENQNNSATNDVLEALINNNSDLSNNNIVIQALRDCANKEPNLNVTFKDKDSYIRHSNIIMELTDTDNNKVIDLLEFYKKDLILAYQNNGENYKNATVKANSYLKKFNNIAELVKHAESINIEEPNCTIEDFALFSSVMNYMKINQNEDTGIDSNELAAYYATVVNYDISDNTMTLADIYKFNSHLESGHLAEYDIDTDLNNTPLPVGCKIVKKHNSNGKEIQAIVDSQGNTLELIDYYLKYYNDFLKINKNITSVNIYQKESNQYQQQ